MIFNAIFDLVLWFIGLISNLLPVVQIPTMLVSGLTTLGIELIKWNRYFPIRETLYCFALYIGICVILYVYLVGSRVYKEVKTWVPFL